MATQQMRLPAASLRGDPSRQAFLLLRSVYTLAPILFGLDKFFNILTDWTQYLAPVAVQVVPVPAQTFMYAVGAVEIAAGLLVAWKPRIGSLAVALWLAGIIANLLLVPGYYDVALRDFGLLAGALALNRLAVLHAGRRVQAEGR
jgi:uncharacterized membrane protein YphA (DoxX/SURF4 family)